MVQVAFDSGPLHGHRTGIGNAVAWTLDALRSTRRDLDLTTYVVSARASLLPGERRMPVPAMLALRLWARSGRPSVDRWLGRPDVVHGTNYVVPPGRAARLVSVYDCWFLDHPEDAHPDVRLASAVLRRSVADGATVVTSSDATTARVRELLAPERVATVHLGPPPPAPTAPTDVRPTDVRPTDARPTDLPEAQPFVLALGTIERRKNLAMLVSAFARLAKEDPHVRLVLAGRPGDDADAVDRAIDALDVQIADRVHRLGAITEATKCWLLEHAVALAYPSLDEGFGFPVLEAQQHDLPVAATTAGSIPEVGGPSILLSPPGDTDALAANLYGLLTSDERRVTAIAGGRRNLDRFSWDRTADRLATLYDDLAAGGTA